MMYIGMILMAVLMLGGCGKSLDQLKKTVHDGIDIGFTIYEDVTDNVNAVKKIVTPTPAKPAQP